MSDAPYVLLVEDNEDDVMFWFRACKKIGWRAPIGVAYDGVQAVDYVAGRPPYHDRARYPFPARIILDLKLPRRSGLEVLEWLRENPASRDLPVIVLSSSEEKSDLTRVRELGVDQQFVKPVSFTDLMTLVQRVADRWSIPLARPQG